MSKARRLTMIVVAVVLGGCAINTTYIQPSPDGKSQYVSTSIINRHPTTEPFVHTTKPEEKDDTKKPVKPNGKVACDRYVRLDTAPMPLAPTAEVQAIKKDVALSQELKNKALDKLESDYIKALVAYIHTSRDKQDESYQRHLKTCRRY